MYTNKKRQRNFKRIREIPKTTSAAPSNPSKRHRERLNNELESVAALLPYDASVIARLDKLSVLRLAVSFLRSKTLFQALFQRYCTLSGAFSCVPPSHQENEEEVLKALGGFLLILSPDGEIVYSTPNVEMYLGFHQSDILHQPIYEMVHSEDRDELRRLLFWNYSFIDDPHSFQNMLLYDGQYLAERQASARFRCFLDNTCGFLRIDIQGRVLVLDTCLPQCYLSGRTEPNFPLVVLSALCIPYIIPSYAESPIEEQFLRSKHSLDMSVCSLDVKMITLLECQENHLPQSFYAFVHSNDVALVGEAHRQVIEHGVAGMLVYRVISKVSSQVYWFQTSCRLQSKNGKPDFINCSHRILTECEGVVLFEKRMSFAQKTACLDETNVNTNWPPFNLHTTPNQPVQGHSAPAAPHLHTKDPVTKHSTKKTKACSLTKTTKRLPVLNPTVTPSSYAGYSTPSTYYIGTNQPATFVAKPINRGYLDYGSSIAAPREEATFLKPYFPHDSWNLTPTQQPSGAWNYVHVPSKSFSIAEVTNTLLGP